MDVCQPALADLTALVGEAAVGSACGDAAQPRCDAVQLMMAANNRQQGRVPLCRGGAWHAQHLLLAACWRNHG